MSAATVQSTDWLTRRRTPRLVPTGHLAVSIASQPLPIELRNLSFGGFAIAAPRPFKVGLTHRFTFSNDTGLQVNLVAKAVHCHARPVDNEQMFVSGWEFLTASADAADAAIGQLLDAAQA